MLSDDPAKHSVWESFGRAAFDAVMEVSRWTGETSRHSAKLQTREPVAGVVRCKGGTLELIDTSVSCRRGSCADLGFYGAFVLDLDV